MTPLSYDDKVSLFFRPVDSKDSNDAYKLYKNNENDYIDSYIYNDNNNNNNINNAFNDGGFIQNTYGINYFDMVNISFANEENDENNLEQKQSINSIIIFFIIIYSIVAILSLIGNSIILIVILRRRRMRIVANFFLANITVANLLYTVCAIIQLIIEIKDQFYFSLMCKLVPFLSTMAINVNIFTIIAASIERLIVISNPFKCKLSKSKCFFILNLIWLLSVCSSIPWLVTLKSKHVTKYVIEFFSYKFSLINDLTWDETYSIVALSVLNSFQINQNQNNNKNNNNTNTNTNRNISFADLDDFAQSFKIDAEKTFIFCEKSTQNLNYYFHFLYFVQYFLPICVLSITYLLIAYYVYMVNTELDPKINDKSKTINGSRCHNSFLSKNKPKVRQFPKL
jgi:hypothetical protein